MSEDDTKKTTETEITLEDIRKRRQAKRDALDTAYRKQEIIDSLAIADLEDDLGESLSTMATNTCREGVAVKAAYRAPNALQYKRYKETLGKAGEKNDSKKIYEVRELLAESCWVYPVDPPARAAFRDAFPGALVSMALEVVKLVELRAEEEKKA